ncbi:MAG: DMT family transporter [Syntrophomonadaceae bacterium]|nr:DMT family transporter [Syntrophomonadaceae bacterium]
MPTLNKRLQAELSMILVACIWGTTFVIVKNALADIGPFLFLGIRFIAAFIMLAILSFSNIRRISWSTLGYGCLIGTFLLLGYTFQTVGLKYTTSSNAGFITGISVVLVPIIYAILNRTRPDLKTTITVLLATAGLYLLSFKNNDFTLAYGDFLVLICAFGFAFHIVFVDRYSYRHNPVAITGIQILFVGIVSMIIGLNCEPWPQHFSANLVSAIFITSVFATSLAFLLQNAMQKYSTPTRFAIVLTTEPLFAALAGYLWANEMLSQRAMAGAALILVSMLVSILTRKGKNLVEANV